MQDEIAQRVVVHFRDGRLLKGYAPMPSPNHPTLDVVPIDKRDEVIAVRLDSVKAVFFVKDFAGDAQYAEQKSFAVDAAPHAGRVAFHMYDNETLVGIVDDYQPDHSGFFLTPVDPRSNNVRCFVVASAIRRASMA